jgi:hypothetical protein
MAEMTPFKYAGFYDVPRYLKFRYGTRLYLLQSIFDDALDDYLPEYSVYGLPDSAEESWELSSDSSAIWIGNVPVDQVTFDPSKRQSLDASFVDMLVAKQPLTY